MMQLPLVETLLVLLVCDIMEFPLVVAVLVPPAVAALGISSGGGGQNGCQYTWI